MKKQMMLVVSAMGGHCHFSGKWPHTLYIHGANKEEIINALIKKFTRHTPIRFK